MGRSASVIECGENAWRTSFLDEVTDNFVVKVLDRCPLDLFSHILFLFCLERKLDENLLKLLVHVVDAKLLERIVLEDFEPVDVEYPYKSAVGLPRRHRDIYAGNNPFEKIVVDCFRKGIATCSGLRRIKRYIVYGA